MNTLVHTNFSIFRKKNSWKGVLFLPYYFSSSTELVNHELFWTEGNSAKEQSVNTTMERYPDIEWPIGHILTVTLHYIVAQWD